MLKGDDRSDPVKERRNLSFQSHNFEINTLMQVHLLEIRRFYLRPFANPYIYAGVGLVNFNPTAELDGTRYKLRPLQTEGESYSNVALSFPVGLGVKFRVSPFINLALDGGYRFVSTDYLDDVSSGFYPDPASFDSDIARQLSDRSGEAGVNPSYAERGTMVRGDPDDRDGYFIFNVKFEYYLTHLGNSPAYGPSRKIRVPKQRKRSMPGRRRGLFK
jgi:hypothetical protein